MDFYLPIAQVQISIITILSLSFAVGFLSGIFGIGGGFLMTPILIFLGIPATYAVANVANNILGISVSGATTHWYRKTLDYKMGIVIVIGGLIGTFFGMQIFQYLKNIGNINTIIALAYIYLLAIVGTLIFVQGFKEISALKKKIIIKKKLHTHFWITLRHHRSPPAPDGRNANNSPENRRRLARDALGRSVRGSQSAAGSELLVVTCRTVSR